MTPRPTLPSQLEVLRSDNVPLVLAYDKRVEQLKAEVAVNYLVVHELLPQLQCAVEGVLRPVMLGLPVSPKVILELRKHLPQWCSTAIQNNPKDECWA